MTRVGRYLFGPAGWRRDVLIAANVASFFGALLAHYAA